MAATRRHFLQATGAAGLASGMAAAQTRVAANDRIRIATIGHGGMGSGDTRYALTIPGVELVAVCDIYDGRLTHAKESTRTSSPRATIARCWRARMWMPSS